MRWRTLLALAWPASEFGELLLPLLVVTCSIEKHQILLFSVRPAHCL